MLKSIFSRPTVIPGPVQAIVVGLGNPGWQYEQTRHNTDFVALDHLAQTPDVKIGRLRLKGLYAEAALDEKKVLLSEPSTFTNLGGQSVIKAMRPYKLPLEQVIIVFNDISLVPGHLHIRRKGSDGGQSGMKNIIYPPGSDAFPRVEMDIGAKPNPKWNLANWVSSALSAQEAKNPSEAIGHTIHALELMVRGRTDEAMNWFNS